MTTRHALLDGLLRTMVREWGHSEVESALKQISEDDENISAHLVSMSGQESSRRPRLAQKILASEQVARANLPQAQKAAIRELAIRFDQREFLPSLSDVREFLIMMGERPGAIKDRSDAFRRLLKPLATLPPERLERLVDSAIHSGPSKLGPLSDAITSAAASLPRHREPSAS